MSENLFFGQDSLSKAIREKLKSTKAVIKACEMYNDEMKAKNNDWTPIDSNLFLRRISFMETMTESLFAFLCDHLKLEANFDFYNAIRINMNNKLREIKDKETKQLKNFKEDLEKKRMINLIGYSNVVDAIGMPQKEETKVKVDDNDKLKNFGNLVKRALEESGVKIEELPKKVNKLNVKDEVINNSAGKTETIVLDQDIFN